MYKRSVWALYTQLCAQNRRRWYSPAALRSTSYLRADRLICSL